MGDSEVSTEELKSFHSIDRDLFARLVVQLRRDPAQALRIIAFWLLLEQMGCPSISIFVSNLSNFVVDALFEEALTILDCIQSETPPPAENDAITRTYHLTNKKITLQYLHARRVEVLHGISMTIARACARALEDMMDKAVEQVGKSYESFSQLIGMTISLEGDQGQARRPAGQLKTPVLPYIPHAFHPAFHASHHFEVGESSSSIREAPSERDRIMFMTFSRGYPVSVGELRKHLMRSYGDVVEQIHMEETRADVQPLYARVIFRSSSAVNQTLNGRERVKFIINGKHVWARRFTERQ